MSDTPYAPPQVARRRDNLSLPILPRERWSEVDVHASVTRDFWKQTIAASGSVNSVIVYDPVGAGERVYLDGQLMVTTSGQGWRVVQPHIEFMVEPFAQRVLTSIDVKSSLFFFRT